ncbi:hypothetical protein Acr_09g0007640 [Actinidia rufa]|uniref:RING-type domain-containing protein n=1 Tax=Actinidia rufa TaxID=165716 RepID=A0A7J0F6I4_9ERIC|nr:hypothetical protein Acr_09g0007640 [Actinidia rufa]
MPQPIWLPPLNSHDDYTIHLTAQVHSTPDPYPPSDDLSINLDLSADFFSSDPAVERTIQGLSILESYRLPRNSITRNSIRRLISCMPFQFPLQGIVWHTRPDMGSSTVRLRTARDFAYWLRTFLQKWRKTCDNKYPKVTTVTLTIEKEITLPADEFEAWASWYDEQKRLNRGFEMEYEEAISRPRSESELVEDLAYGFRRLLASRALLEEVSYEGGKSTCSICLDELVIGSLVTHLPCSHTYRGECVSEWLKKSNECPLCRYVLRPDRSLYLPRV